ncbi:diaminobutyrate acetyltransferase [Saccharothrix ecbatanensis]|jgi:diaminobutyrate acetyltransferase|uniref:L-2,4-diaminobutyric acid acetyltransferase n=1 Tax=Saccharothrix ecbatanensis TaxID=1105145 RepID=A0A7W9M1V3_9PSEU|nr:diaminobutyrate acetyltransferase [Saccharothrix ecbatanensis]MBB5804267.1 diaminobutyrate acetyltransferase [Saccharothrix ecbatanensis]
MFAKPTKHGAVDVDPGPGLQVGRPSPADGGALWRLARDTGVLDVNSSYAYLLWTRDFAATSVVARHHGDVVGFVSGYTRPDAPDTLFVWQVGVDARHRGRGVARAMLDDLVGRGTRFLETTVTATNEASIRLFGALARDHDVRHTREPLFTADLFPDRHEAEELHRLGPWPHPTPGVM